MKIIPCLFLFFLGEIVAKIKLTPQLIEMGFRSLPSLKMPTNKGTFDSDNYLIYQKTVNWRDADTICKTAVPNIPLNLISLESKEELDFINNHFRYTDEAGEFWTSGRFNASSPTGFSWENGMPVSKDSWAPWAPKNPPPLSIDKHRVTTSHGSNRNYWKARRTGELHIAMLCELPEENVNPDPKPCPPVIVADEEWLDWENPVPSHDFLKE